MVGIVVVVVCCGRLFVIVVIIIVIVVVVVVLLLVVIHRVWKLSQILADLQNSFTVTLSSKFAIKKSLNILPSFTHVATLPCKTVVLKNHKLHCRPILKTFNV